MADARGQALLNFDTKEGVVVRRTPLLAAVADHLVPGLTMEMLRVATGSTAIEVQTGGHGVTSVQVADLVIPTQPGGDIWLHYARQSSGTNRYVSAQDVLLGRVDPDLLAGKLVVIGFVGAGLNDMLTTALNEVVAEQHKCPLNWSWTVPSFPAVFTPPSVPPHRVCQVVDIWP